MSLTPLPGCGGDDDSSEVGKYRERIERLCRKAERDGERLARGIGESVDDAIEFFRKALVYSRREQKRHERIEPPQELANEHERSVELGREAIEKLEALVRGLDDSDNPAGVVRQRFPPLARIFDESNDLAREMKLDDCVADSFGPPPESPNPS